MTRWHLTRALVAGALIPAGLVTAAAARTTAAASSPPGGIISTIAGGPGAPDPAASVSVVPCGVKFTQGQLYIGDNTAVQRVSQSNGWLTPVAGTGSGVGSTADGVPAATAAVGPEDAVFPGACGDAVDSAGNVLLADGLSVRVVAAKTGTYYRHKMTAGDIYTVASGFNDAVDVELAPAGLVVADQGNWASHTDPELDAVIQVAAQRTGTFYGQKMTAGKMYVVAGSRQGYAPGNGTPATRADLGVDIGTVRLDGAGNLIVADTGGGGPGPFGNGGTFVPPGVRVVAARSGTFYGQKMKAGYLYTIAGGQSIPVGNGVPGTRSGLASANGVALDQAGNVVIADGEAVRVVAARSGTFYGQKMKAGYLYAIAGTGVSAGPYSGDGGPATRAVFDATGVAVDSAGNVLVADDQNHWVLAVAARSDSYYGRKMTAGHIYSVAGNGRDRDSGISPAATAVDAAGNVLIGDGFNDAVWVVPDKSGSYYQQSMTAGDIYLLAGHGAAKTLPGGAGPVAVDPAGNVLVSGEILVQALAESNGTYYGRKMTKGDVYTIAGGGVAIGDGGPATRADVGFYDPLAIGYSGNLLLADLNSARIRSISR